MDARAASLSMIAAVAATIALTGAGSVAALGGASVAGTSNANVAPASKAVAQKPVAQKREPARSRSAAEGETTAASGARVPRCAGCAVVESIRRIDRREDAAGVCAAADSDALPMRAIRAAQGPRDIPSLDEAALAATGGTPGVKKIRIATSYQIVVRFRDGSRRVFNEVTPRSLQTGDRIQVIAGAY